MSAEIKSYTELPIDPPADRPIPASITSSGGANEEEYAPFEDEKEVSAPHIEEEDLPASSEASGDEVIDIDEYKSAIADAVDTPMEQSSSPNYESMSLKELQSLAKSRNIVGVTKKGPLIEALKTSDRISTVKPGSVNAVGSNSFLESSAPVSDESL